VRIPVGFATAQLVSLSHLFDSDKRFGMLDRTMVRRYLDYESAQPVLRCEAPVLCAHSLNAQNQLRRQTEKAGRVSLNRRVQRVVESSDPVLIP
jgi:hypothetical protein